MNGLFDSINWRKFKVIPTVSSLLIPCTYPLLLPCRTASTPGMCFIHRGEPPSSRVSAMDLQQKNIHSQVWNVDPKGKQSLKIHLRDGIWPISNQQRLSSLYLRPHAGAISCPNGKERESQSQRETEIKRLKERERGEESGKGCLGSHWLRAFVKLSWPVFCDTPFCSCNHLTFLP